MPDTTVRLKYTGAARYFETPITGAQQSWLPGQSGFVSSTDAAALLGTGLFEKAEIVDIFAKSGGFVDQLGESSSTLAEAMRSSIGQFDRFGPSMACISDSFGFQNYGGNNSGLTLTRSNDIVTVSGAASHPFYPGSYVNVHGCAVLSNDVQRAVVQSYLSSSSFTYYHPGQDGNILAGPQSICVANPALQQSAGFWSNYSRLTGAAYRLVANVGVSGATTSIIKTRMGFIASAEPSRVVVPGIGYNDISQGLPLATTVANLVEMVQAYPGALWDIFSPWPFLATAGADSAANLRQLQKYFQALKEAFRGYSNVRVHNSPALLGASTGYAATGMVKNTDKIHPAPRGMYTIAKYLAALDASFLPTPVPLLTTALDTFGADASSKHLVDDPLMTSSGGSVTNVTGTFPAGVSGTLGGTGAAGTSTKTARADGFGNDWVITYTPSAADWNLRASWSLPVARFPSGGRIDKIVAKVSITGYGSSNAANIKSAQLAMAFVADGVTYAASVQEASGVNEGAAYHQQEDVTDLVFCIRDVPIPVFTALTLARLDFLTSHYAAGTQVTIKIAQVDIELA